MTEETTRTKLLKGVKWPRDRHGDEIDSGDFVMFVHWSGWITAKFGKVTKIDKGGNVFVEIVKIHPKDEVREVKVKECKSITKLSQNMISALTLDKLASI